MSRCKIANIHTPVTFHYISQKPYADALIMAATEVYSLLQLSQTSLRGKASTSPSLKKYTLALSAKHNLQY